MIRPLWPQLADHRRRWSSIPDRRSPSLACPGPTGLDFRFDFQTANLTLFVIASASEAIHIFFHCMDCFVAFAPRNDETVNCFPRHCERQRSNPWLGMAR